MFIFRIDHEYFLFLFLTRFMLWGNGMRTDKHVHDMDMAAACHAMPVFYTCLRISLCICISSLVLLTGDVAIERVD